MAIVATVAGALTPLSREDANAMNAEIEQLRSNITVQYIFGNNLMICMLMFVPVVGPIFGFWALYNTGVFIAAQTIAASVSVSPLVSFLLLFLFPFAWLEFISYSIGFAESFYLIRRGLQGYIKKEVRNVAILIAIVALLLLIGAIIEVALITAFL